MQQLWPLLRDVLVGDRQQGAADGANGTASPPPAGTPGGGAAGGAAAPTGEFVQHLCRCLGVIIKAQVQTKPWLEATS